MSNIAFEDLFIPLEDLEYGWSKEDVIKAEKMWEVGADEQDLAKAFKRPAIEVAILIADRIIRKRIKPRNNETPEQIILRAV